MFDFRSVAPAPKGAARGKCLPAHKLAFELGVAVLRLALSPERPPIHRESVQRVSAVLAAAYTQPQSTIPTYLGQGRSDDGLKLHRLKAGAYPCCRENAALALRRLEQLGYSPSRVAALLGLPDQETLLAAVAGLPDFDTAVAALAASSAPSPRPAADSVATAETPAERKEKLKEEAPPAPRKETAKEREQREWAETQARIAEEVRRQKAEQVEPEEPDEQVKSLMAELEADEE